MLCTPLLLKVQGVLLFGIFFLNDFFFFFHTFPPLSEKRRRKINAKKNNTLGANLECIGNHW